MRQPYGPEPAFLVHEVDRGPARQADEVVDQARARGEQDEEHAHHDDGGDEGRGEQDGLDEGLQAPRAELTAVFGFLLFFELALALLGSYCLTNADGEGERGLSDEAGGPESIGGE